MEDKAHQGDFYVLDVSFAQRVHKLLLPFPRTLCFPSGTHGPLQEEGNGQTGSACRSGLPVLTGFARKSALPGQLH